MSLGGVTPEQVQFYTTSPIRVTFILALKKNNHRLEKAVILTEVVGAKGFEPSTSRSRTVRSTGLSHAPLLSLLRGKASRIIHAAWAFDNPTGSK
jgi:hypothetical protein